VLGVDRCVTRLFYNWFFSYALQTHDNFSKDFKIITGWEHSGERGNVAQGVIPTVVNQQ